MTVSRPAPIIAAHAIAARRRLRRAFAGATSPDTAIAYEPPRRMDRRYFRALIDYGAIVVTGRGTYWLDEEKLREHTFRRRKRAAAMIGAVTAAAAAIVGLTQT